MPQIKLIAIHNFAGAAEGDLPFEKGDELIGLELTGQWWSGVDMNDKKGQFPANYVQKKQKVNQAGMGAPPPGPVKRRSNNSSNETAAPTSNYGQMPGATLPDYYGNSTQHKTRLGLVAFVRGIQVLCSLFALSFMGSTTQGQQYKSPTQSMAPAMASATPASRPMLEALLEQMPSNDGVRLVLAMSIIGWLEACVMLLIACLSMYNISGIRDKLDTIPNMPWYTIGVDGFIAALTLLAVTICPTEMLMLDKRARAAAVFLMFYLFALLYSILMSYKDIVKLKLIAQGWTPPPAGWTPPGKTEAAATSPTEIVIE